MNCRAAGLPGKSDWGEYYEKPLEGRRLRRTGLRVCWLLQPLGRRAASLCASESRSGACSVRRRDSEQRGPNDQENFDTFGSEAFWGNAVQHRAIAGAKNGGVGDGVSPKTALSVGLKVDSEALPDALKQQLKDGKVDLDNPATTLALLKLNAVVGVKGIFDQSGNIKSVGIECAFCHSTVDDSFAPGIGKRLDGWANRDLNVGAIVSLVPNPKPFTDLLGVDVAALKKVLGSWGPGCFDAELDKDGKALRPDGKRACTLIPPAFGLAGVNLHTWTGFGSPTGMPTSRPPRCMAPERSMTRASTTGSNTPSPPRAAPPTHEESLTKLLPSLRRFTSISSPYLRPSPRTEVSIRMRPCGERPYLRAEAAAPAAMSLRSLPSQAITFTLRAKSASMLSRPTARRRTCIEQLRSRASGLTRRAASIMTAALQRCGTWSTITISSSARN